MRRSRWRLALAALVALVLTACGAETTDSGDSPGTIAGSGTQWELQQGQTSDGPLSLVDGYPVILGIDDGKVQGRSACNSYTGRITLSGETLRIFEVGGTEMACEPEVMSLESGYLAALLTVDEMSRDGDVLLLTGPQTQLRFVLVPPVPTADLIGTAWVLETLVDAEVASSTVGEPATLRLDDDGTFVASTGCRQYTGRYVVTGGGISATASAAAGECPDDIAAQDDHVISVLERFRAVVDGNRLTLTGERGRGLVYRTSWLSSATPASSRSTSERSL